MELLAGQLVEAGYRLVSPSDEADVYILNTCTVTHVADRKCRNWLRQVRSRRPDALVVATGCYAERAPAELGQIKGISLIAGNDQKSDLMRLLPEPGLGCSAAGSDESALNPTLRTRALIKIQDGCRNFCSYCIVPLVRGEEKSVPPDLIINGIKQKVADGYKEVVLTGTEIGSYDYDGADLKRLVERILAETKVIRLRLSSLQPPEITPELIELWRDDRLCRHFHLSLQSGSDGVLRRMNRRYSVGDYQQAVALIRARVPEAAVTTDIITGFPGETGEESQESYDFCRRLGFARIHVFPYSPRPGTEAARMQPYVPDKVKKWRTGKMLALARESAHTFRQQFLGKTMPVLWEKQIGGTWSGLTDNYIRVYARTSEDLTNRITLVELAEIGGDRFPEL